MKRFTTLALLLVSIALFAAPPFDDRWDGTGYRPEPQAAVPGVTQPPTWEIFADNIACTNRLNALDASSDPASTYKWHSKWRRYNPTDNRVAVQIRCEENRCFKATEFNSFVADPLPSEWNDADYLPGEN